MTARWPVAVFHNILDVSACNAYVVWTAIDPAWNQGKCLKRRLFLAELGKALVTPLIQRRQHLPRTPGSGSLVRSLQAPGPTFCEFGLCFDFSVFFTINVNFGTQLSISVSIHCSYSCKPVV